MNDIKDKCDAIINYFIDNNVDQEEAIECINYLYAASVTQQLEDKNAGVIHQKYMFSDCNLVIVATREVVN